MAPKAKDKYRGRFTYTSVHVQVTVHVDIKNSCTLFSFLCISGKLISVKGGELALWLVCLTPKGLSTVESWPGTLCCALGHDNLLSQCLSSPGCILNGYRRI